MSLSKLKQTFPLVCGLSPYACLRQVRLERAMHLLGHHGLGVTETALEVGYANLSHFAKAFAAYHGINPSQAPHGNLPEVHDEWRMQPMKKKLLLFIGLILVSAIVVSFAMAQESANADQAGANSPSDSGNSLEDRIKHLEEAIGRKGEANWSIYPRAFSMAKPKKPVLTTPFQTMSAELSLLPWRGSDSALLTLPTWRQRILWPIKCRPT